MCNASQPKYKRILLKLSGEALSGNNGILDFDFISSIAEVLKKCVAAKIEVAVIVGAGNIWRGRQGGKMDRVRADHMGMLATTINALALEDTFKQAGLNAVAMTAVEMNAFAEQYTIRGAVSALEEGKVVIFGCGLGSPFFSTDTAAALRAAEIGADAVLMAKNIDGVYSADPKLDPTAVRYDEITYNDVLAKELKALDLTATAFCMDNDIRAYAFELKDPMNIYRVAMGEKIGTELHR
ncbi:MAG: UMP kinase [Ruminococcaceae bacterium]|nr:UMP kinase [Oscillospiraceae bacterium]